jgi:hypothetical protein
MSIQNAGKAVAALTAMTGVGCASTPQPKTTAEQASGLEQSRCASFRDDSTIAEVLSGRAVERVEPLVGATMADAREILSRADSFLSARGGETLATDLSGR